MTISNQSECFISVKRTYASLKVVYGLGSSLEALVKNGLFNDITLCKATHPCSQKSLQSPSLTHSGRVFRWDRSCEEADVEI